MATWNYGLALFLTFVIQQATAVAVADVPELTPIFTAENASLADIYEQSSLSETLCKQRCLCRKGCVAYMHSGKQCLLGKTQKLNYKEGSQSFLVLRDRIKCVGSPLFELIQGMSVGKYEGVCPVLPVDEDVCFKHPTKDEVVGPVPYTYYRIGQMVYDTLEINCAVKCLLDNNCEGIERDERNGYICWQLSNKYGKTEKNTARAPSKGKVQLKMPGMTCPANTPSMVRLFRSYQKLNGMSNQLAHFWGRPWWTFVFPKYISMGSENSGICFGRENRIGNCPSIVQFGRNADGSRLSIETGKGGVGFHQHVGYCMGKERECGASEKVDEYYRKLDKSYLYLVRNHPQDIAIPLGFVKVREFPCSFWPGHPDLNCDYIADKPK